MFDRIFSAILAFVVLAAGTLAVATEMFGANHTATAAARPTAMVELPEVQVIGQRLREVAQAPSVEPVQRVVE